MSITERTIAIITYLATNHSSHGVTDIARDLHINKATVFRILSNLEQMDWITQEPKTRKYRLGSRALAAAFSMVSNFRIENVSLPYLYELRDETGETALLSLRIGSERVYIQQIQGRHSVRVVLEIGQRFPLWQGAAGTAMLAYLEPVEMQEAIKDLARAGSKKTPTGKVIKIDELYSELQEIREKGFAVSVGTSMQGAVAVASPIFGSDNRVIGAISIGVPVPRLDKNKTERYGILVKEIAQKISKQMGSEGDIKETAPGRSEMKIMRKRTKATEKQV